MRRRSRAFPFGPVDGRHALRLLVTAFVVAACLACVGCGETVQIEDPRPASQRNMTPMPLDSQVFVDASELQTLQAEQEATVIDARTKTAYDEGHLPGAIHSGNEKNGRKPFKNAADNDVLYKDVVRLQDEARAMGISRDRPVVIYGTAASKRVGRLYWTLEYLGHGEVYAYTPGYDRLKQQLDFTPSTDSPDVTGDFVVSRRASVLATNEDVRQVAEGDQPGILLDTRRESEFNGTEDRGDPRQGYIPEAVHYHWENLFTEDGELRDFDELEQEFQQKGFFEPNTVIVPYCQTGTRSAYLYAVLRALDSYETTPKNYDGSWVKWSRDTDYPVAQPDDDTN